MIRKISFVFITLLFVACGSQKNVTTLDNLPDWVKKKPIVLGYYVGIGSVQKTPDGTDFQDAAKNNALADLASEISVTISSHSVLNQFESVLGYSEDFSAQTQASTKVDLEGYELVNSFDSPTHYYVYYRLSKEKFAALQEQHKQDAISKSLDFYQKALASQSQLRYLEAIASFIKGLEMVKPYLSESLETNWEGNTIYLGNELFNGLLSTIQMIRITPKIEDILVKNGATIGSDQLRYTVSDSQGNPLEDVPIEFTLGNRPLRNNRVTSDADGTVSYSIQVGARTGIVNFVASLDANTLANQFTTDPIFRKMMRRMKMPEGIVRIQIKNPTFFVSTIEKNLDNLLPDVPISLKIKQLLANNGFPVVADVKDADYRIELEYNTNPEKIEGQMYYVVLSGNIKVMNDQNQLILLKPIEGIKGVRLNNKDAGFAAIDNLADYMNRNLLIKLKQVIK